MSGSVKDDVSQVSDNMDSSSASETGGNSNTVDVDARNDDTMYTAQYFGFTSKTFCNGIYNAVSQYILEGLDSMETILCEECKDDMSPGDIKEAMFRFKPGVEETINKAFDKLEIYLDQNIFNIPRHVVLPEDAVQQTHPFSREERDSLDRDIDNLRNKILAVKYANMLIVSDIKAMDEAQTVIDPILSRMKEMRNVVREAGISDLKATISHNAEQVMTLIKNVKDLQTESSETSLEPITEKCKMDTIAS